MKNLIERMYEYYDEMDEDDREYYHKQKESAPSYDPDAYKDDFNCFERMC